MQKKNIISINSSVILAKGEGDFAMHDIVRIGEEKLLGEVIKINKDVATIQIRTTIDRRDSIKAFAELHGESVNIFINRAIDERMLREGYTPVPADEQAEKD